MTEKTWGRLESDTKKSYEAFHVYLTMGTRRSLSKVGQKLGKSEVLIERWSTNHNWQVRIQAYDAYLAAIDLADYEDKRLASRKTRQSIVQGLEGFLAQMMKDKYKNNSLVLTLSELSSMASAAKTIMGESRQEFNDLPTERKELTGKDGGVIEYSKTVKAEDLSDDELAKLAASITSKRDS